jgi:hypothetical protein
MYDLMYGKTWADDWVSVSDEDWVRYTGMDPKSKANAIRGLKEKKFLRVEGSGAKARYWYDRVAFKAWAKEADHSAKPRTAGRVETKPAKPGQKLHPECADRGCARLCESAPGSVPAGGCETARPGPVLVRPSATGSAVGSVSGPVVIRQNEETAKPVKPVVSSKVTRFRKPVSEKSDSALQPETGLGSAAAPKTAESGRGRVSGGGGGGRPPSDLVKLWPLSLAELQRTTPGVGAAFLARLLSVVNASTPNVNDADLCDAIKRAWNGKAGYQRGVGLFLETVPEMLQTTRTVTPAAQEHQAAVVSDIAREFRVGLGRFQTAVAESPLLPELMRAFCHINVDALVDEMLAGKSIDDIWPQVIVFERNVALQLMNVLPVEKKIPVLEEMRALLSSGRPYDRAMGSCGASSFEKGMFEAAQLPQPSRWFDYDEEGKPWS